MGNANPSNKFTIRLNEFELRRPFKKIQLGKAIVNLNCGKNQVGDYFINDIADPAYGKQESQAKSLIKKEIVGKTGVLLMATRETLIISILRNNWLRKRVIKIIRNKGLIHPYRWQSWYFLATFDSMFQPNGKMTEIMKELYSSLLELRDRDLECLVDKDVSRTSKSSLLFKEKHSIGSIQLFNVCKAVGLFFPKTGYVQGMNFIVAFLLEVNGFNEFETFNFLIHFWMKRKNLFYGLYEKEFPLLKFLTFAVDKFLYKTNRKVYKIIKKIDIPHEVWTSKWFLSFFTLALEKEFVLRIFDFLITSDIFGPIYVVLAISSQLNTLFHKGSLGDIIATLQNKSKLSAALNFQSFSKTLENMDFDSKMKLEVLNEYNNSLTNQDKLIFESFYYKIEEHILINKVEFYDDFDFDPDCTTIVTHNKLNLRKSKTIANFDVITDELSGSSLLNDFTNKNQKRSRLSKRNSLIVSNNNLKENLTFEKKKKQIKTKED